MASDINQFPFSAQNINPVAWPANPNEDTVLFWNTDLNNTVSLGYRASIKPLDNNTIPLPPNGQIALSGKRTVYAVAPNGTANLVVIPGGGSPFRSLTQGLGSLVVPSIHSPNYIVGTSGWTINKDGSVEFNNGVFRGNIVGGALFIYSGAGALGNPPQLAIVPPGTVNDPFGNAVTSSKILMQGNIITESGGIFRTSPSAPLIQLDGPHDCIFVYDSSANLIVSVNPGAQTTDGLGHTVFQGLVVFDPTSSVYVQLGGGGISMGTAAQLNLTGGAFPGFLFQNGAAGAIELDSGGTATSDVDASISLFSKNNNGGQRVILLNGPLQLSAESPAALVQQATAFLYDDTTGLAHTKSARPGDTNNYIIGKMSTWNTADQLINSLTFANILNSLLPIGAGKYRLTGRLTCLQGPNAVQNDYRLAWTGTLTQTRQRIVFTNVSNPASPVTKTSTSNVTNMPSPAYPAATTYIADIDAVITTSSTGNLSMQAACDTAAANTFTVLAASDWLMEVVG